ncbi:sodium/potassium-transporting ATPase subunit beta-1-interacting protein 3-like [Halichondria panicea]|uniref:sodium/potassium-transporting ATPase subunit beta-1-interacting protein 3-like n=1 Tax=Halichondria panicea TaxID=6063 RepID=UPI00312BAD39
MAKSKYLYYGWKRKLAILFYLLLLLTLLVSIERLVFDVFGQMWGTMLVNGMNLICTITGLLGTCIKEKIAMAVYIVWNIISIGLNIVIVLIYQDIGLLAQNEDILGLKLGNDNWWRTNGPGCSVNTTMPANDTLVASEESRICVLTYVTIETIHAAVYMFLAVVAILFLLPLLCSREETHDQQQTVNNDDEEDFSYVNVDQWYDNPNRQSQCPHGTNITTVS